MLGGAPPTATPCPGDINGDGVVNTGDLGILLAHFGLQVPPGTQGDLNGDGVVTTFDLGAVLGSFGVVCATDLKFKWDGGFIELGSHQLTQTFSRSYATASPGGGGVVPADTPRYWLTDRLLCGLPTPVSVPLSGSPGVSNLSLAGGVASDSTTPMVVGFAADPAWVDVMRFSTPARLWRTVGYVSGGTPYDLLRGTPGHLPTDPRPWERCFNICHGLLVAVNEVQEINPLFGIGWVATRTGLCFADESGSGAGGPLTWSMAWMEPDPIIDMGHDRGVSFACQEFRTFDTGPVLNAWFAFTDYQHNQAVNGGNSMNANFYLVAVSRPSVGAPWAIRNVQRVLSYLLDNRPAVGMHAHPPAVDQYGDNGLCVLCPIGDSRGNNRVVAVYRDDASTYDQGQASGDDGGTQNGWTTRVVHGSPGALPPAYYQYGGGEAAQFVGSAPLPAPGQQLIGGDEMLVPIMKTAVPANQTGDNAQPAKLNLARVWGQPAGGLVHDSGAGSVRVWNAFRIPRAGNRSGPYCVKVTPGFNWRSTPDVTRLVYSPDGEHFAPFFATRDNEATDPIAIAGDAIYCSYLNSMCPTGPTDPPTPQPAFRQNIVALPFPSTVTGAPLAIGGPGDATGTNLLLASIPPPVAPGQNSVTALSSMPPGVPSPPALGPAFRCRIVDQRELGTIPLTAPGAVPPGKFKLRFWLYFQILRHLFTRAKIATGWLRREIDYC